jgi:ABC-type antimicrobial peptide transport system permease subunit
VGKGDSFFGQSMFRVLKKHTLRNAMPIARFSSLTQNNLVTWLIGENFEDGGVSAGENVV